MYAELQVAKPECENGTNAGRWQCGEDGEGVDIALTEYAKQDIDSGQRRQDQEGLVRKGLNKRCSSS